MRISDWSSDVCSSDLLAAGIAVRHLVFGDAVGIQAAELRPGLEDDDVMAVHGKAMRAGQPRRAAADHGDLPPGTGGAAERMRIDRRAMIGRVSLQKSDRDRLAVLGVAHAGALAEDFGRADPRAGAAENILFVDRSEEHTSEL